MVHFQKILNDVSMLQIHQVENICRVNSLDLWLTCLTLCGGLNDKTLTLSVSYASVVRERAFTK